MLPRLLFVVFLLLSIGANGQSLLSVVAGDSNQPIPFVPVSFMDGTTPIFSATTDDRGSYTLSAAVFEQHATITYTAEAEGYEPQTGTVRNGENRQIVLLPEASSLDEFIVTGQLSDRKVDDAVQKARVIDRKTIDAKGAVNLRDVLLSELNIRISQDQVLGSGMSLQGMNGQNVKILIDGVPVIGRVDGEIDLSQINLATIERIEIVEGPSSVSYGSNALAGTINLITKKKQTRSQTAQLNSYYETVGNYNLDAQFSFNLKKSQLQLFGQRNYFDGWINGDPFMEFPKSKVADSGRYQSWKPKMQYQAGVKWIVPIKNITLTPYVDYFYEKIHNKGLPRAPQFNSAFDDYYYTNRLNQGIQINAPLNDKFKLQGVIAYNYYERIKNTYIVNLNTLDRQLTTTAGDQDTTRFTSLMSRLSFVNNEEGKRFRYEFGYDVNHETAFGQRILDKQQAITEAALFTNMEWQFNKLIVKPGLRATYNSSYRSSLTPALNLKYATTKWNYRLGIASGFRSPSIKELYLDFVDINHNITGNLHLKPEQSIHMQGWIGTRRMVNEQPLSVDVNGYYQIVQNKITLAQDETGVQFSYFNLDAFEATGMQAAVEYRPGKHQFRAGFAYIGTKSNLTIDRFAFSPEVTATASVFWKKPGLIFSTFYKYTGRVQIYLQSVEGDPVSSFINDYHLLDASVSRSFLDKRIVATIGGKNLLNVRSVGVSNNDTGAHAGSATSTPVNWGRSVYVKLQFNLKSKK